ncbi:polymorphic toxin-type HINT domain-containing protein [Streptomyces sp. LN699]|uniref:polymorphic toxin-type HINT domain-containing protein n=1 Tax=Streptomyces sp. LN699 TaxID=3112981 RepID=UPI00371670D4
MVPLSPWATAHGLPDDWGFTDITLAEQDGGASVTATDHHPFWSGGQWTDAGTLHAGGTLLTSEGKTARIAEVRHRKALQPACNLTVDDLHGRRQAG